MGIPVGDESPRLGGPPLVNLTLIMLNIILFFLSILTPWLLAPGARSFYEVIWTLGFIPAYFLRGERLYTLLTSMFLHGNLVHLLGNMLYLYVFGDNVEVVMGRLRYIVFYIVSGLVASLIHTLYALMFDPSSLIVPAVGASGAISGVLGAYLVLFPWGRVRVVAFWGWIPMSLSLPAIVYIGFWFLYQLLMGLMIAAAGISAGVAFWAHIGGFIAGLLLAKLFADKRKLAMARYAYMYYY
ncbi:MAG: rhomboid family intramembrane serine protease [Thermoprotei archaeon]|nr:rhomboid family intramembrane serine protease [Thermoprotei archaeon]